MICCFWLFHSFHLVRGIGCILRNQSLLFAITKHTHTRTYRKKTVGRWQCNIQSSSILRFGSKNLVKKINNATFSLFLFHFFFSVDFSRFYIDIIPMNLASKVAKLRFDCVTCCVEISRKHIIKKMKYAAHFIWMNMRFIFTFSCGFYTFTSIFSSDFRLNSIFFGYCQKKKQRKWNRRFVLWHKVFYRWRSTLADTHTKWFFFTKGCSHMIRNFTFSFGVEKNRKGSKIKLFSVILKPNLNDSSSGSLQLKQRCRKFKNEKDVEH